MQHVPGQQPGHRLQADVRMRRNLHARHPVDRLRPVVIDEAPRPDAAPHSQRQQPAHGHAAYLRLARGRELSSASQRRLLRDLHVRLDSAHSRLPSRISPELTLATLVRRYPLILAALGALALGPLNDPASHSDLAASCSRRRSSARFASAARSGTPFSFRPGRPSTPPLILSPLGSRHSLRQDFVLVIGDLASIERSSYLVKGTWDVGPGVFLRLGRQFKVGGGPGPGRRGQARARNRWATSSRLMVPSRRARSVR